MYHVALVNVTDHVIEFNEAYEVYEDAQERLWKGLQPQHDLNELGIGTCEKGKDWLVYGIADKPFEWPLTNPE